jgi:hypothetical protein
MVIVLKVILKSRVTNEVIYQTYDQENNIFKLPNDGNESYSIY